MFTSTALLVAHQPGVIVGPIAKVLGLIKEIVVDIKIIVFMLLILVFAKNCINMSFLI